MRKTLAALAAAATIVVATVAAPTAAEARWWHGGFRGPGPFFGGFVAGALIAGAVAPRYYWGSPYYSCVRTYWNGWTWVRYRVC